MNLSNAEQSGITSRSSRTPPVRGGLTAVLATAAVIAFAGLQAAHAQTPPTVASSVESVGAVDRESKPLRGVYDPHGAFQDATGFSIEHIYMPWQEIDLGSVEAASHYALDKGRQLLITVEPWTWFEDWSSRTDELLNSILAGSYDPDINAFCRLVGGLDVPVMVRWAHEMELGTERFAWSRWGPEGYVAAYRHFVDTCRPDAPNALFMWSPAGEDGLADYYPGDEYADLVGVSVFGLQEYDQDHFGRDRSFSELLGERYARVAQFGKPVAVAEFGCDGDDDYVNRCIHELRRVALEDWPQLESIVYFNAVEPVAWPGNYGKPDWRVTPGSFKPTS